MNRFENKTILITGASSGIGLAGAKRLTSEGANVIITGRTPSRLEAAAKELGDKATAILDDVSDGKTLERLMPAVEKAGGLDGVWLNAAYVGNGIAMLEENTKESLEQVFWVNSMAPMLQMAALSPHIRSGGAVLVTSSSAIHEAQAGISLYSASKAALHTAALSWATELAPRNIRVNILVPGPITSNLRAGIPDSFEAMLAQNALLKRVGDASEAAAVALFLLSDDASYVTGSAYEVNGGFRP